jgi:hypothetical protein
MGLLDTVDSVVGTVQEGAQVAGDVAEGVSEVADTVEDVAGGDREVTVTGGPQPRARVTPTSGPQPPAQPVATSGGGIGNAGLLILAALAVIAFK